MCRLLCRPSFCRYLCSSGGVWEETGRRPGGICLETHFLLSLVPPCFGLREIGQVCPITTGLHREWAWSGMAAAAVACFSRVQQACCAQLRPSFPTSLRNAALAGAMFDPGPCISSSTADQPQSDLNKETQTIEKAAPTKQTDASKSPGKIT